MAWSSWCSWTPKCAADMTFGPTWTTGVIGSAVSFNGANQYANAGMIPALTIKF